MFYYILKRILSIVPILILVVFIVYGLMYNVEGVKEKNLSSWGGGDSLDAIFAKLNIQETFFSRCVRYLWNIVTKFDFGQPTGNRRLDLGWVIGQRMATTLTLSMWSFLCALLLGVPLGAAAALRKGSAIDKAIMAGVNFVSSLPGYGMALFLVLVFTIRLNWLPAFSADRPGHMVLPVATLAVGGMASTVRFARMGVLGTIDESYVQVLHSKGLKKQTVIWVHILKNAAVPIVANLNEVLTRLLCGAIVVEQVFVMPGLGRLLLEGVAGRDMTVILGCTVVISAMITVINICTDTVYTLINPRLRQDVIHRGGNRARKRQAE